MLKVVETGIL